MPSLQSGEIPGRGGAESSLPSRALSVEEFAVLLATLGRQLEDRSAQLGVLEALLVQDSANRKFMPTLAPIVDDPNLARALPEAAHALLRAQRLRAADSDFQATYRRHRPMVERSIAWLTRGNPRLRYRGTIKNNHWLHHRTAALNLRRLLTLGLNHHQGTWTLT